MQMRTVHQKNMASSWLVPHDPDCLQSRTFVAAHSLICRSAFLHVGVRHERTSLQHNIVPSVLVSTMLMRSWTLFSARGT